MPREIRGAPVGVPNPIQFTSPDEVLAYYENLLNQLAEIRKERETFESNKKLRKLLKMSWDDLTPSEQSLLIQYRDLDTQESLVKEQVRSLYSQFPELVQANYAQQKVVLGQISPTQAAAEMMAARNRIIQRFAQQAQQNMTPEDQGLATDAQLFSMLTGMNVTPDTVAAMKSRGLYDTILSSFLGTPSPEERQIQQWTVRKMQEDLAQQAWQRQFDYERWLAEQESERQARALALAQAQAALQASILEQAMPTMLPPGTQYVPGFGPNDPIAQVWARHGGQWEGWRPTPVPSAPSIGALVPWAENVLRR